MSTLGSTGISRIIGVQVIRVGRRFSAPRRARDVAGPVKVRELRNETPGVRSTAMSDSGT
jgi:hypothetical protein